MKNKLFPTRLRLSFNTELLLQVTCAKQHCPQLLFRRKNAERQPQVSNLLCAAEPSHQAEPTSSGHQGQNLCHMRDSTCQRVGRSSGETATCWQPWGGKRGNMEVARCRQTCKSAAAGPHQQPPNCLSSLLIAPAPPALSGQGLGIARRSWKERNPPTGAGDALPGQCRLGTARVPRGMGMAQFGPWPPHTGHCLVHTNLSLPRAKKT